MKHLLTIIGMAVLLTTTVAAEEATSPSTKAANSTEGCSTQVWPHFSPSCLRAATGAVGGAIVGGPAGAAVGATVGAVAGGIADESRPRFRTYVGGHAIPLIDTTVRSGSALICHPAA
jgi:hypothetical protein